MLANYEKDFTPHSAANKVFFYCVLLWQWDVRGYLESSSFSGIEFLFSRDYTTLPYLTIGHTHTVGVSDLCCLEQHTEPSASVTEIAFRNPPASIWVRVQIHSPDAIFLQKICIWWMNSKLDSTDALIALSVCREMFVSKLKRLYDWLVSWPSDAERYSYVYISYLYT